jgi:hypothetical protein
MKFLIFLGEVCNLLFESCDLILVESFFPEFVSWLNGLVGKILFIRELENDFQNVLKPLSLDFMHLLDGISDVLKAMVFKIRGKMGFDYLIHFVFVVKVDARSRNFAGDVFVKIFKFLNDALNAESDFLIDVRGMASLLERLIHPVK